MVFMVLVWAQVERMSMKWAGWERTEFSSSF
jgi:hypothetical protein